METLKAPASKETDDTLAELVMVLVEGANSLTLIDEMPVSWSLPQENWPDAQMSLPVVELQLVKPPPW